MSESKQPPAPPMTQSEAMDAIDTFLLEQDPDEMLEEISHFILFRKMERMESKMDKIIALLTEER